MITICFVIIELLKIDILLFISKCIALQRNHLGAYNEKNLVFYEKTKEKQILRCTLRDDTWVTQPSVSEIRNNKRNHFETKLSKQKISIETMGTAYSIGMHRFLSFPSFKMKSNCPEMLCKRGVLKNFRIS